MTPNVLLEMRLFDSAKETANKLRWDADVAGTRFSIYIPKWRVPEPWPSRILITVMRRRSNAEDAPNMTEADALADPANRHEPIIASVTKVSIHTETIRYQPTGHASTWELGSPYIPFSMTCDGADKLRIVIQWDITSRGLFHEPSPVES